MHGPFPNRLLGAVFLSSSIAGPTPFLLGQQVKQSRTVEAPRVPTPAEVREAMRLVQMELAMEEDAADEVRPLFWRVGRVSAPDALESVLTRVFRVPALMPTQFTALEADAMLGMLERYGAQDETKLQIWHPEEIDWSDQSDELVREEYNACVAVGTTRFSCDPWTNACWCCSGVCVAANVVLVADHCFDASCLNRGAASGEERSEQLWVYFGNGSGAPGQRIAVRRFERFDPRDARKVDVAALILDEAVTAFFDGRSTGIVVPPAHATTGQIDAASEIVIAGFGLTDDGIVGKKNIGRVGIALHHCGQQEPDIVTSFGCVGEHELVATAFLGDLDPARPTDTCDGDSGGPAFIDLEGELLLAGITSRAVSRVRTDQRCGSGGIYVRIDDPEVRAWISEVIARADLDARDSAVPARSSKAACSSPQATGSGSLAGTAR